MAQPALTRSIHRLEKELEVPLFVRKGRGILLTEYGKALQQRLLPVIETLDRLPEELHSMTDTGNRTVRLNVLAASAMATSAVIAYKKKNPDVRFQLIQKDEVRDCDIEITTKMVYQTHNLSSSDEFVCKERVFLAVSNSPPYAGRKKIGLSEAANEGFVVLSGSRAFRNICDRFCHRAGFQPRICFESDSPTAVRDMIAANMGVGFWPEFTWGSLGGNGVLLLEIEEPICTRELIFTRNNNGNNSRVTDSFFQFLRRYIEDYKNRYRPKEAYCIPDVSVL